MNGSPDVDAIFRLTQDRILEFQKQEPVFLPEGVFCPYNSQNTLIHPVAFFTLYLPSTVSMRTADIWRGYISQRLLWEHQARLVFFGPNAVQKRNEHSLEHDFQLEVDLYLKTSHLIECLGHLTIPPSEDSLKKLIVVYEALVEKKLVEADEMVLLEAWVQDLQTVLQKRSEGSSKSLQCTVPK